MSGLAKQLQGQGQLKVFAKGGAVKGGAVKHDDVKEDKAMIKKMVKSNALTGKKKCGKVCGK